MAGQHRPVSRQAAESWGLYFWMPAPKNCGLYWKYQTSTIHLQYLPLLSRCLEMDSFSQLQMFSNLQIALYCSYPVRWDTFWWGASELCCCVDWEAISCQYRFLPNAPLSSLQLWLPCSLFEQVICSHACPRHCLSNGEAPNGWQLAKTWGLLPSLLIFQQIVTAKESKLRDLLSISVKNG